MRTYHWQPATRTVIVNVGGHRRPLEHIVRHSPDGFMCGCGGSGSADLALSILHDALPSGPAEKWYQAFKWAVIAEKNPRIHWTITMDEIKAWFAFEREKCLAYEREKAMST